MPRRRRWGQHWPCSDRARATGDRSKSNFAKRIRAAKPRAKKYDVLDHVISGFGGRVYPSGAKVYVVQTRALGKSKRVTLGRHGVISADQARRKAAMTIARIKAGEDPSPTPSVSVAELTVTDLAERYLKEHAEVHCKPRTKEAYRWLVVKFVLPELGKLAIEAVEREHITALHYGHRETPYQANRILKVVRKMFNLAEAWGLR